MELAKKRLRHEVRVVQRGTLHKSGIFINVDENNEFIIRALIIGPDETPYRYGYYMFHLHFSETKYPFVPPKVLFCTLEKGVRFNPNLYEKGKVCLSIINTWQGEQWTSCQSLQSILLHLQTILTNEPLQNEPGFTTKAVNTCPKHKRYYKLLEFVNYKIAIIKMIHDPPPGFEIFMPVIREQFLDTYPQIMTAVQTLAFDQPNKETISCLVYSMTVTVDYIGVLDMLQQIYTLFLSDGEENTTKIDENTPKIDENTTTAEANTPKIDENTTTAEANTTKIDENTTTAEENTVIEIIDMTNPEKSNLKELTSKKTHSIPRRVHIVCEDPMSVSDTYDLHDKSILNYKSKNQQYQLVYIIDQWYICDTETKETLLFSSKTNEKNVTKLTNTNWFKIVTTDPSGVTETTNILCKIKIQKNHISCRPTIKAKDFENGYITETQLNNTLYTWKVYTDAKGSKRWTKL